MGMSLLVCRNLTINTRNETNTNVDLVTPDETLKDVYNSSDGGVTRMSAPKCRPHGGAGGEERGSPLHHLGTVK